MCDGYNLGVNHKIISIYSTPDFDSTFHALTRMRYIVKVDLIDY